MTRPPTNRLPARRRLTRGTGSTRRSGGTTLETFLALFFVLLPLTFGTLEFSYFFYTRHTVLGAAREGARAAILPDATNAKVNSAISTVMTAAGLGGSGYVVRTTPSNVGAAAEGDQITVKVECSWSTLWRMQPRFCNPGRGTADEGKVVGTTVMRKEG